MITVQINECADEAIDAKIEFPKGEWNSESWEEPLIGLAQKNAHVIFVIDELDPDGLIAIVLKMWLKHSEKAMVEANNPNVETVLSLTFDEKVQFI